MKRVAGIAVVFLVGLIAVGFAVAGANGRWSQHANGSMEVPARDSQGQGQGIFKLSDDGNSIDYKLIASNIDNVFMAHIHMAGPGVNGPIVGHGGRSDRSARSGPHGRCVGRGLFHCGKPDRTACGSAAQRAGRSDGQWERLPELPYE
jgi:hypothetical protein